MNELNQILRLWQETRMTGESAVLATVVETHGSSYRLPGARLLLTQDGRHAGSISGGCLEDDLIKKAWWLTERGPIVRKYDTTPEGEIGSGFGLGCNGTIHVLLERLTPGESAVLDAIADARVNRYPTAIVHVVSPAEKISGKLIVNCRGLILQAISDSATSQKLEAEAKLALTELTSRKMSCGTLDCFIEVVAPPTRLLVFGAGEDAVPLTRLAKYLGWQVSVFDGRAHYARREKFPDADEVAVYSAGKPDPPPIDDWTVAILMSHSYSQDLANLRELLTLKPTINYLGVLGPRKRTDQLFSDAGIDAAQSQHSLYSPVGLDIGADGPEQVALAVVAEIQAVLNGRQGGLLREHNGSIHARASEMAEQTWVNSIVCA